jgi:hypothetical protein
LGLSLGGVKLVDADGVDEEQSIPSLGCERGEEVCKASTDLEILSVNFDLLNVVPGLGNTPHV